MATYNSPVYTKELPGASPIGGGHGLQGVVRSKQATISVDTNLAAADVLNFFYAPKGARVVGWRAESTDLDTGTPQITLDVGVVGETDKFFDGIIIGQAGTSVGDESVQLDARNFKFIEDTLITGVVAVVAATAAAGTITLTMLYVQEDFTTS